MMLPVIHYLFVPEPGDQRSAGDGELQEFYGIRGIGK